MPPNDNPTQAAFATSEPHPPKKEPTRRPMGDRNNKRLAKKHRRTSTSQLFGISPKRMGRK